MRTWARITARAAVIATTFAALGVTAFPGAFADAGGGAPRTEQISSGAEGIGSGNQVDAPISVAVNVCGNAIAIFGTAEAGCERGTSVQDGAGDVTSGRNGAVAGNQVNAPVSAPVNVCGNAVAVLGKSTATCEGGAEAGNGTGQSTSGASSLGGGNQAAAPVSAPVNVCGNAAGHAVADCEGGAGVQNGGQASDGESGVLSGNQAGAPVSAPVSVCGNAAGVPDEAGGFCDGGAHVHGAAGEGPRTSGKAGTVSGNQLNAPADAPSSLCGNIATVPHHGAAACDGAVDTRGGHGPSTSGDSTTGSGNQANIPANAPSSVCGNAGAVGGHPETVCEDGPAQARPLPSVTRSSLISAAGPRGVSADGQSGRMGLGQGSGEILGTGRPVDVAGTGPDPVQLQAMGGLLDDTSGGLTGAALGGLPASAQSGRRTAVRR